MSKKSKKALAELQVDALIGYLRDKFSVFPDTRASNASISMVDALMSGYAMFALKDPSLLEFNNERSSRSANLETVYGIKKSPSDSRMRELLDAFSPRLFCGIFEGIVRKCRRAGVLRSYQYYGGSIICSVDGVHHFSSDTIKCDCCTCVTKSNGILSYRHSTLSAAIVHPHKKEVLPIAHEAIVRQDGCKKNDCERNAAKRLLPQLGKLLYKESVIMVEDALAANGPHIRAIKKELFGFVINIKPDSHTYLFDLLSRLDNAGQLHKHELQQDGFIHTFKYVNDVPLNASHRDIRVGVLDYHQHDPRGKKKDRHFTWITDLRLNKRSVYKVSKIGRARWKIENETFNTLKNQDYHFGHNYGHGKQFLCSVFMLLMMLAFFVDQLQQGWNTFFKAAHAKTQTKQLLWKKVRQKFDEFVVESMHMIYLLIIGKLTVRYEIIEDSS